MGAPKPYAKPAGAPLIERPSAAAREAPMRATLEALGPATIVWDAAALRSLDMPGDLAVARDEIVGRRR